MSTTDSTEAELHALSVIAEAYGTLDQGGRERVTRYLFDRFVSTDELRAHDHDWALSIVAEMYVARAMTPQALPEQLAADFDAATADVRDDLAPSWSDWREACAMLASVEVDDGAVP